MFLLIYRQRIRILYCAAMLMLAFFSVIFIQEGLIFQDDFLYILLADFSWSGFVFGYLFLGLCAAVAVILITMMLPIMRMTAEVFCTGVLLITLMNIVLPEGRFFDLLGIVPMVLAMIVMHLIYQNTVLKFIKFDRIFTASTYINAPQEEIWAAFDHTNGISDVPFETILDSYDPIPDAPGENRARYIIAAGTELEQIQKLDVAQEPNRRSYFYLNLPAEDQAWNGFEVFIEPAGPKRCRVTLREHSCATTLGVFLFVTLDDNLGSTLDSLKARLEGRFDWSTAGRRNKKVVRKHWKITGQTSAIPNMAAISQ